MAEISVIIPCFNRATLIGDTIRNMLAQTVKAEIIVVDDGSTDNSVEVIESFGEQVKLIRQANQGPGAARNAGLKASSGAFIQFMDSDDLASANKLATQVNALKQQGGDFAYGPWVRCQIVNNKIQFLDRVLQTQPVPDDRPMLEWFLSGWSLVFQNCVFRRSILQKAGYYRTDLMPSEDSEYFIRILCAGAVPVHTPDCLVFYREHEVNKITSTGTSSTHRANDWTKFLDITGTSLDGQIPAMKAGTRRALAANVANHLNHCRTHHLPVLPPEHPYNNIPLPGKNAQVFLYRFYQRFMRRWKNSPDYHPAFKAKPATARHRGLVTDIGFAN